jgi:hypothetical protein
MTLTINDTTIISDQNPHTARRAPVHQRGWEVSWLPGQILDRNTAITAMILADIAGSGDLHESRRLWPHIESWAAELGLTGPDAITRACQPILGLDPGQERASGQPDREAGRLTSQPDTTSRPPGRAHLKADPPASPERMHVGMTRGDPQSASVVNAMAGSARQLPPGTSAEPQAALIDPEPEAEADERDEPERGSQDSDAYQARVEAGLEPEAGS